MSHQVDVLTEEIDKAMRQLRLATKGIPVRREKFKGLHENFARSVAAFLVELSYARGNLRRR
ncbi:hypothetical protein GCM10012275_49080 [Longimycelium tulufanense]|uniref:Uncharacterized protein n=1 Tax=Longimycelium tulufanense TaxID=907463 RepID=A0A8J3CIQ2_9PSEU|nr:hypothetical protein [Longimycelium tulufanense]GGM72642.1 hypothetical protein GCM10012275_49080 [Longimycelium tulufanense]